MSFVLFFRHAPPHLHPRPCAAAAAAARLLLSPSLPLVTSSLPPSTCQPHPPVSVWPFDIRALVSPQVIRARGNELKTLPVGLTKLWTLEELLLDKNPLVRLPFAVASMPLRQITYDVELLQSPPLAIAAQGPEFTMHYLKLLRASETRGKLELDEFREMVKELKRRRLVRERTVGAVTLAVPQHDHRLRRHLLREQLWHMDGSDTAEKRAAFLPSAHGGSFRLFWLHVLRDCNLRKFTSVQQTGEPMAPKAGQALFDSEGQKERSWPSARSGTGAPPWAPRAQYLGLKHNTIPMREQPTLVLRQSGDAWRDSQ